ncbi:MAG: epoxyqueuosine reductase QueH [Candidatus Krumholzibacteria bacterium]|nr:epoxyqueuosine reductase QueH [Candidatus Krumholzibacteria bacterium]
MHACCASCSSYVLAHLAEIYETIAYYYNPNIHPESEYRLRLDEMRRVCRRLDIELVEGSYRNLRWWKEIAPFKDLSEKSERCWACYRFRLDATAKKAAQFGIPLFTTTLSVSPHKVFERIDAIGREAAVRYGIEFLAEDFKKKNGFKISVERSREMGLSRQDYCGCLMSLEEARKRRDQDRD